MLLDLGRNDVGRISQVGTVTVPEKMAALEPAVKTEASQLEAVQQAKADTITQPEQAPVKAQIIAEKAGEVSEPKQTPVKGAAVTSTKGHRRANTAPIRHSPA